MESGASPSQLITTMAGRRVGPYLVEARLGGGAMASVYRAVDQRDGRRVALKVLLPDADATVRERFRQEARMVSILDHPNIVHTLEVSANAGSGTGAAEEQALTFIAMELVDGESLGDLLDRLRTLNSADSCALLAPVAQALHYAHGRNVVHRDVKPSNILLRRVQPGTPGSVRLTVLDYPVAPLLSDFGIARALDAPDLTSVGRTIGTPAYMSPEQCAGSRDIDGRADIYALGAVLYRALVGRAPYVGTTTQILYSHVYDPVAVPDEVLRTLSPLLVEVLRRSLAKEPEERYSAALEMAAELLLAAGGAPSRSEGAAAATPAEHTATMPNLAAADNQGLSSTNNTTSQVIIPAPRVTRAGNAMRAEGVATTMLGAPSATTLVQQTRRPLSPGASIELMAAPNADSSARRLLRWRGVLVGLALAVPMFVLLWLAAAALLDLRPFAPASAEPVTSVTLTLAATEPVRTASATSAGATATSPPVQTELPAGEAVVDAAAPATAVATPTVIPTDVPTITPTPGPLPTPSGDIALYFADAQDFYAERDWDGALEWLTIVQRINPAYERAAVDAMLFDIHAALGARAAAREDLSAAIEEYGKAVAINPGVRGVTTLLEATQQVIDAPVQELPTLTKLLQLAHVTYSAELARAERPCEAAEQAGAAVGVLEDPPVRAYALELAGRCREQQRVVADKRLLDELPGRLLYSTQVGDGHYRIYVAEAAQDAPSAWLIDNARQPALSPNGVRVAFHSTRNDAQGLAGFDLGAGLDPGARSVLYTTGAGDGRDSPPAWNVQGTRLVYASFDSDSGRSRIFTLASDGRSSPELLAEGQSPAWRWSSDFIAYNGFDERGLDPGLWLTSPDGGQRIRLTDNGTDIRPVWTPNGSALYFMSNGRSGDWDVYRVDVPAGTVTQMTNDPAQDGLPAVSPDGKYLAFMSDRGGAWAIWVRPVEGGDTLRLTGIEGLLTSWLEHSLQWIP